MRAPIRICTKCGVRLIPYTYNYIYDEINRKAIRVCKHCHDEHIRRKKVKMLALTAMSNEQR
nr:MAG TPA: TFIIB Transcription factor zinc-finger [Caudoviricetes sp.]